MTRLSRSAFILIVILAFAAALSLSVRWLPYGVIKDVEYEGIYSISAMRIGNSSLLANYYRLDLTDLRESLEAIGYVDKADIRFWNGKLTFSLSNPEKGLLLVSSDNSFLYDGNTLREINREDVNLLGKSYSLVNIDDSYLLYLKRYGTNESFERLVHPLFDLGDYTTLITRAEFDNNNSTGNGRIKLYLDSLNSVLTIAELQNSERVADSIKAIEREVGKNPIKALEGPCSEYELRLSGLVRIKR